MTQTTANESILVRLKFKSTSNQTQLNMVLTSKLPELGLELEIHQRIQKDLKLYHLYTIVSLLHIIKFYLPSFFITRLWNFSFYKFPGLKLAWHYQLKIKTSRAKIFETETDWDSHWSSSLMTVSLKSISRRICSQCNLNGKTRNGRF